mgnify:CR=1 FL=1
MFDPIIQKFGSNRKYGPRLTPEYNTISNKHYIPCHPNCPFRVKQFRTIWPMKIGYLTEIIDMDNSAVFLNYTLLNSIDAVF